MTPVGKICENLGISTSAFYVWLVVNEEFMDSYLHALETRALVEADEADRALQKLLHYIEHHDDDPREKHVRTVGMRLKMEHMRWKLGKYNRRVFGDKLDMTATVTLQPAEQRSQAWSLAQQAKTAEYVEVPTDPSP